MMDNYPDDIFQYNWHPDSPFYIEPKEEEDDDDIYIGEYIDPINLE